MDTNYFKILSLLKEKIQQSRMKAIFRQMLAYSDLLDIFLRY